MSDARSTKAILVYFWKHALRYPFLLWGMIISVPLAQLFNRYLPALIMANILDRLSRHDFIHGNVWGSFGPQLLEFVGLTVLGGIVLWRVAIYFNWKLEGLVQRDINQEVYDHLLDLSADFHANSFGGALVSQTSKLAGAYVRITDTTMFQTAMLFTSLVYTSIILWSRAQLFVLILNGFAALFTVFAVAVTVRSRHLSAAEAEAGNQQTAYLADSITNVMAIKSFATARAESKHFAGVSERARLALMAIMRATMKRETAFSSITTLIASTALLMGVIGVVVYNANIATVFLVISYTGNVLDLLWEVSTQAMRNYNRAFGDAQAMVDTLSLAPEVRNPAAPETPHIKRGAIEFKDMSFSHAESQADDSLFAHLSIAIKPSEKIGLVGHSGSGKTTLTRLLLRFSDIDGGEILIDGQNIAHIKQDILRRHIAYVPQEPLLFHRTIRENIAYGKPSASQAEIVDAARKAHALEFIDTLPNGFETMVGERGVKLSGGQRQRIAIARAILKDAPILVLDEATSALDSESEKLIQDALWKLMEGRTAIVIAHRLSTIQKMDRILVLDHGEVVEQGSHHELLSNHGTYAKLWAHQSGGFIED